MAKKTKRRRYSNIYVRKIQSNPQQYYIVPLYVFFIAHLTLNNDKKEKS